MNIYLLRHGLAADNPPRGGSDADRRLTAEGARKTWLVAERMEVMTLQFDRIYSSPYLRARQTAEIVAEAFNLRNNLELTDCLMPGGDFQDLIKLLSPAAPQLENVLLVGHEPYLSGLAGLLISGRPNACLTMKKSGLCKLAVAGELKQGRCASLEWLLTPKLMGLMK